MIAEETTCVGEGAGAGDLSFGACGLEHVVQLALQPQPVRPVPEVVEIELKPRVLGDADHIVKISWSARS